MIDHGLSRFLHALRSLAHRGRSSAARHWLKRGIVAVTLLGGAGWRA